MYRLHRDLLYSKLLTTYKPRVGSLRENLKPRPSRIDRATRRSIRKEQDLRFSTVREDRTFEVNKLFIMYFFALVLQAPNLPVGISGE